MSDKIIIIGYGLFLMVGAYFGWKAGSQVSLIMGIVSGCLVLLCVYLASTNFFLATQMLGGISGLLTIVFLMRFLKTHKVMPSGMLLVVSLAVAIFAISQMMKK